MPEVPALRLHGVRKAFGAAVVVHDVSLDIRARATTGLIGPNGAGKTTLFNLVAGVVAPDAGRIEMHGQPLLGLSAAARAARGISRTFQEIRLFPTLTALENVMVACQGNRGERLGTAILRWGIAAADQRRVQARAEELLAAVGLAHLADRLPTELSYGQQKRVGIARALATGQELLLLDEPAAGLDPDAVRDLAALLRRLAGQVGTILLIEHNLELVRELCDEAVFLDAGRVVVAGPPAEVLEDPRVWRAFMGL
ncbi:ABC transporter ATP-binding protein [Falsiroseomonas oryzae]|uniref:ABC transporter ATP-binding protein n=1 Tax=Falsiroseomonas oryzae TaxID=2766473 RepID=UPI0022EAA465|nr:ABC transporter ATP-binding protein [Roseomonas sp. MO-31]